MSLNSELLKNALKETKDGVLLSIIVQPGAKKTQVVGIQPNADTNRSGFIASLKIKIHAPPVDGKANEEIIRFLSEDLHISQSKITLFRGDLSRNKVLKVSELTVNQFVEKLMKLILNT